MYTKLLGAFITITLIVTYGSKTWIGDGFEFFASVDTRWVVLQLLLAAFLLAYTLFRRLRVRPVRFIVLMLGIGMFATTSISLVWPYAIAPNGLFQLPVDLLIMLEGSIVALLAHMELPAAQKSQYSNSAVRMAYMRLWAQDRIHMPRSRVTYRKPLLRT